MAATDPRGRRPRLLIVDDEPFNRELLEGLAEMLGCAEGTVKSRCSRGRTRLAGLLLDLHQPPGDAPHGNPPPDGPVQPMLRPRGPPSS